MSKTHDFNINSLSHYMFTSKHIMDLCLVLEEGVKIKRSDKIKDLRSVNSEKNIKTPVYNKFIIPAEKDKLFWCYYILSNGEHGYSLLDGNIFKEEKEEKINLIEKIRQNKDILKKYKWKRGIIENELVYDKMISLNTFLCICAVSGLNVAVIKNKCIYSIGTDNMHIIKKEELGFGCYISTEKSHEASEEMKNKFNEYVSKFWLIENIAKPLAGISSYKILALQNICKKLGITIINDKGKKLKKVILYNLIKSKIN